MGDVNFLKNPKWFSLLSQSAWKIPRELLTPRPWASLIYELKGMNRALVLHDVDEARMNFFTAKISLFEDIEKPRIILQHPFLWTYFSELALDANHRRDELYVTSDEKYFVFRHNFFL